MSVLQIAGKNPNNVAKGIAVETDGEVITSKKWETSMLTVLTKSDITTGDAFGNSSTPLDVSNYGILGLRINYTMPGTACSVNFYTDTSSTGTAWMYDIGGTALSFTIPAASESKTIIITPDDFRWLPYLRYIKVRVDPSGAPTSAGSMNIYAIVKR